MGIILGLIVSGNNTTLDVLWLPCTFTGSTGIRFLTHSTHYLNNAYEIMQSHPGLLY